jgi:hypothetical protein
LADLVGRRAPEQPVRLGQDGEHGEADQDRVPVGRGARRCGVADGAAGAAAVVDDDATAEDLLERLRDGPAGEISLPAGRVGHDHVDVAGRPALLRGCTETACGQRRQGGRADEKSPPIHHGFLRCLGLCCLVVCALCRGIGQAAFRERG